MIQLVVLVPIARLERLNRLQEIPHRVQIALLVLFNHQRVNHLVLHVLQGNTDLPRALRLQLVQEPYLAQLENTPSLELHQTP